MLSCPHLHFGLLQSAPLLQHRGHWPHSTSLPASSARQKPRAFAKTARGKGSTSADEADPELPPEATVHMEKKDITVDELARKVSTCCACQLKITPEHCAARSSGRHRHPCKLRAPLSTSKSCAVRLQPYPTIDSPTTNKTTARRSCQHMVCECVLLRGLWYSSWHTSASPG